MTKAGTGTSKAAARSPLRAAPTRRSAIVHLPGPPWVRLRDDPGLSVPYERGYDVEVVGLPTLRVHPTHPLVWRPHSSRGDRVELWVPKKHRWRRLPRAWLHIVEGLEAGEDLPQLHARLKRVRPNRTDDEVRTWLKSAVSILKQLGLVEVELPPVPAVFRDRYEVLGELGRGGMGVVWLARDLEGRAGVQGTDVPDADHLVAIKHAWNWNGGFESRERVLRQEAELMRAVDNPHITRFVDAFQHEGRYHLVREFVDGPTLVELLQEGPVPEPRRLEFAHAIADGLAGLLEAGYFCLDIKPANYIVTGDEHAGVLKLVDLGLCRQVNEDGELPFDGHPGTRGFVAPETRQEKVGREVQAVYAVGRIYMNLVRRRLPRETYSLEELLDKMEARGASRAECELTAACCAPEPEDRIQTLRELVDRIERAQARLGAGEPGAAPATPGS